MALTACQCPSPCRGNVQFLPISSVFFLLVLTECLCYCHDDFPLSFAPPFHLCRQYRGYSIVAIPFTAPLRLEVADCNLGVPFGFFLVSQSLSFCSTNLSVGCLSYSPNTSLTKK